MYLEVFKPAHLREEHSVHTLALVWRSLAHGAPGSGFWDAESGLLWSVGLADRGLSQLCKSLIGIDLYIVVHQVLFFSRRPSYGSSASFAVSILERRGVPTSTPPNTDLYWRSLRQDWYTVEAAMQVLADEDGVQSANNDCGRADRRVRQAARASTPATLDAAALSPMVF